MANVKSSSSIEIDITLSITEDEARALLDLAGYGIDKFLETFYTRLGKHYLSKHEAGIRTLFGSMNTILPVHLNRIDRARSAFDKKDS